MGGKADARHSPKRKPGSPPDKRELHDTGVIIAERESTVVKLTRGRRKTRKTARSLSEYELLQRRRWSMA